MAQEAGQPQILTAARGPFTGGYTSSVPAFMARPDQLIGATDGSDTNSSRDVNIDPFTGAVSRRAGCSILNDSAGAVPSNGLLNASMASKCRKLQAIDSPGLVTSVYPTLMGLFGEDTNASFPTADAGFNATIWLNSTNSTANSDAKRNYSLLEDFVNNTTYSRSPSSKATAADYRIKVVPIWMDSGDGVYFRGNGIGSSGTDKFMQQFLCAGSRSVLQTQNWLYSPNLRATPWRWNKNFNNDNGTVTTRVARIYPTGPFSPLWPPQVTTPSSATSGTSWSDGDTFYLSVAFVFEDGSPSAPFIPRAANDILTGTGGVPLGLGLAQVGTVGGSNKYRYITYSKIPLGPEGTTKRVLLRTVKQNRTATTDNITVAPLDLRIIGVLNNNTQTSYVDYGGDDGSLLEDDDFVAVDWTVPRRARFIGTGDSRAIISYTLPNTAAIMLAPVGINNNYDRNVADTNDNCYSVTGSYVRITSTQLELHYNGGTSAPDFVAPGNAIAFAFATYDTLEKLVDAINGVTYPYGTSGTTDFARQWAAQLVPGIDPTMPTTSLTLTTMDVTATSSNGSTFLSSSAAFGSVGVGMKVSGAGIVAGTYVVSKTSASQIILSEAAGVGAGGPGTFTFYQDTGDTESISGGTLGYMRAFSSTFPLLLHMKPSAFPDYATPDKASVYFTDASPGAASSGVSLAPNNFNGQNRRLPPASPKQLHGRMCMGIVDIEGAGLIAYNDGIFMFANQRGANTGEDFDCRLFDVNNTRGCISYLGLCAGNGWAAYATTEGIVVTDKNRREFCISGDIFNPTENVGDLAYEIGLSAASASGDTDDQYLGLNVRGSKLVATFRQNSGSTTDPKEIAYNFSPGVEASGVEELLSPDTKTAYIWSPPATYNAQNNSGYGIGAIGSIINASGRVDYVSIDDNRGSADGHILTVGTGVTDDVGAYSAFAVPAPVVASEFMALSPQDVEVTHLRSSSASGTSALDFANNQTPTFNITTLTRALPINTSKVQFQKQTVPIDETQRGKTDLFWMQWRSTVQVVANRVWRMVLRYTEVEAGSGAEQ